MLHRSDPVYGKLTQEQSNYITQYITYSYSCPPTLTVSPSSGMQGTTFYYSGAGYTPNGVLEWHVLKPDGIEYPAADLTGKVDGVMVVGSFYHTYTSRCTDQLGEYTLWAIDKSTERRSNDVHQTITANPSCSPVTESCNGIDDDGNGLIDDNHSCWVARYRFRDQATGARCWNSSPTAPSTCPGYQYEIEAWVAASTPIPATFPLAQRSRQTDHILVMQGSSDYQALIGAGYNCNLNLSYVWPPGEGPVAGSTLFSNTCEVMAVFV